MGAFRLARSLLAGLAMVACGGSPKVPDARAAAVFEIAPVTFLPNKDITRTKRAELHDDGAMFTDGKEVGHFKDGDLYIEPHGLVATLQADGTLAGPGYDEGATFQGSTLVKKREGTSFEIAPDGTVSAVLAKGGEKKTIGKLESPTKATKAALVLVTMGIVEPPEKPEEPVPEPPPEPRKKKKPGGKKPGGKKPGKKPKSAA